MSLVSSCPRTKDEFSKASQRIGCGIDTNGHDLYICIPNEKKTSLVEFCYNEVMGAQQKGHCLEASFGKIIQYNCKNFLSGCPNETFFEYGFYKYPACQNINTKHNCYVMDPSCPSIVPADDNRHTDSDDALVYACSILGSVIVLLIVALILAIILRRRKENGASNTTPTEPRDQEANLLNQQNGTSNTTPTEPQNQEANLLNQQNGTSNTTPTEPQDQKANLLNQQNGSDNDNPSEGAGDPDKIQINGEEQNTK